MGHMPPDQLTQDDATEIEAAVLSVLAGSPLTETADRTGMEPTNLADAVRTFHQAGHAALTQHATSAAWSHLYLHFTDWPDADRTFAAHILPLLTDAENAGTIDGWWYTRKHPCWRLRLQRKHGANLPAGLRTGLDRLVTEARLQRWWPGIYEPETAAFGGPASMAAAHTLFMADSREIQRLPLRTDVPLGRRELSVLLCTTLMRAAGLEWYEQGDVWHHVITADHRSAIADVPPAHLEANAEAIRTLLTANVDQLLTPTGPLSPVTEWATAFHRTGQALADAVQLGTLDRGLRHVLSYHVIFHWNRLGLSMRAQSALAWAARTAILGAPEKRHGTAV